MITALTALLVLLSLGLVVSVPVALATPGEWETSKDQLGKPNITLLNIPKIMNRLVQPFTRSLGTNKCNFQP